MDIGVYIDKKPSEHVLCLLLVLRHIAMACQGVLTTGRAGKMRHWYLLSRHGALERVNAVNVGVQVNKDEPYAR